jgi:hypothetical protein
MGFLNTKTDLTGSIYTNKHLEDAQKIIPGIFNKADPKWIGNPSGILSTYWKADDEYSICFVLTFCIYIFRLDKKITSDSVDKVFKKIYDLLNCKNKKQFKELLFEFEVVSGIIDRISPINFEPLTTINVENPGLFIPSPDLGFLVDEEEVLMEITCPRVEKIKLWEKQCIEFEKHFQNYCEKHSINTFIEYEVPLTFKFEVFKKEYFKILVDKIIASPIGEFEFSFDQQEAKIKWKPIKSFTREELKGLSTTPQFYFIQDAPNLTQLDPDYVPHKITSYHGVKRVNRKLAEGELNELIIKSFRNTLQTKKDQLKKDAPYVLVIKISRNDVFSHNNHEWIESRIFENSKYNWINGVYLFESDIDNVDYRNPHPRLHIIIINKNAKIKCDKIETLLTWNLK